MMALGCFSSKHEQELQIFPPFFPSVSPPYMVLVSARERCSLLFLVLPLIGLK